MSTDTPTPSAPPTGSAALLGDPGAPPPAAPPAGGAPPAPPAAPPAGGDGAPWYGGIENTEVKGWIEKKGWKSIEDAFASHHGLERMLSSEKIPVPKNESDAAAWNALYKAVGRPDDVAGYGLDKVEGLDPAAAGKLAEIAHANGLSVKAVQSIIAFDQERMQSATQAAETAFVQQQQVDGQALRQEWGQAYDAKIAAAGAALRQFGLDAQTLDALDRSIGMKRTLSIFADIGAKLGEAPAHGMSGGGNADAFMTPAQADARITSMKADPETAKRLYNGDAALRSELDRLTRIAVGAGSA